MSYLQIKKREKGRGMPDAPKDIEVEDIVQDELELRLSAIQLIK